MKKFKLITILISICVLSLHNLFSQQTIIAAWDFENEGKRELIDNAENFIANPYTADEGNELNINKSTISLNGSPTFSAWVVGAGGTGTFSPNTKDWNDASLNANWQIVVNTISYENITLSSKQRSSGTGPQNFIIQFSVDGINWTDVIDANIVVENNFNIGILDNLQLPSDCNDIETLYIRWAISNNMSVNDGDIAATGTSRIDDIILKGTEIINEINEAEIISYKFDEQIGETIIDNENRLIEIEVPFSTNLSEMVAIFTLSPNATATVDNVVQQSGITINDFSDTVIYIVTSSDELIANEWRVVVKTADPNHNAEFISFSFAEQNIIESTIDSEAGTIHMFIYNPNLEYNLIAIFELSPGAIAYIDGIIQESGVNINDFTNAVTYNVIAEDGETQKEWTVYTEIVVNSLNENTITELSLYPNPNQGSFMFEVAECRLIDIFDINGKIVYSKECTVGTNYIETHLSKGIYFTKYRNDKTQNSRLLIIE